MAPSFLFERELPIEPDGNFISATSGKLENLHQHNKRTREKKTLTLKRGKQKPPPLKDLQCQSLASHW